MIQEWCCEGCGQNGAVTIEDKIDLVGALAAIAEDHNERSQLCRSVLLVRVRNRFMCPPDRWELAKRRARFVAQKTTWVRA